MARLKSCGSLWKGKCKNGIMLSGSVDLGLLGSFNIMVFPNTKKNKSTAPDYYISVKDEAEGSTPTPSSGDEDL